MCTIQSTPNPQTIDVATHWVSDGLAPCFQSWIRYNPVLISAQTGQGKNHFIMNTLIPYAAQTGQRVVLLSNRIALSVQQKIALLHALQKPNIYSDDELIQKETFDFVTVWSYQSVLSNLNKYRNYMTYFNSFPPHGYLILDEAHFFTSDAPFNAETQSILAALIQTFCWYKRIYMSATPDNVLPIISFYENSELACRNQVPFFELFPSPPFSEYPPRNTSVCVYQFPRNYSNYNIKFLSSVDDLPKIITRTPKTEKWLCFINSKSQQKDLMKSLKEKTKREVSHFDSSLRKVPNNKIWNKLIAGTFPGNILLTTSVIDNGVNITDPAVKNIVIDATDKVSFLQMLGRRRVSSEDRINVFVLIPDHCTIVKRFRHIEKLLGFIKTYEENPRFFLIRTWENLDSDVRSLFFVDQNQNIILNKFAHYQLQCLSSFYSNLLFQMEIAEDPNNVYPSIILEWMHLSNSASDIQWENNVEESACNELQNFLNGYAVDGVPLENQNSFYKQVLDLLSRCQYSRPEERDDIRSPIATLNRHLAKLDSLSYQYQIKKENNIYRIIRTPRK